jgi:hypothetical protein
MRMEVPVVRKRKIVVATAAIALALVPIRALGASVTYSDPDDFEIAPDVHFTTKTTFRNELGRRVRIGARGDVGPRYRLRVFVDSRGGDRADFVMVATVRHLELQSFAVRHLGGAAIESNCDADPYRAWWGVARRDLDPDKPIRWRIVALRGPGFHEVTDLALDSGWYG